jgi:hypothetical protein
MYLYTYKSLLHSGIGQTAIISVHIIAARIRELLRYFVIRDIFLIMKLVIVFII